jgi:hypothetical protein
MNPPKSRRLVFRALLVLGFALAVASAQHEDLHHAEVEGYESISGGKWVRGPNITDEEGNPFPRQEQSVVRLNDFIYLVNGLVPVDPPPEPTEDEPDPAPVEWGRATTVFVPAGHPFNGEEAEGAWLHLWGESLHPTPYHHLIFTVHEERIWTFGGHEEEFLPTDGVYVFTPDSPEAPEGTWSGIRVADGEPCELPPPGPPLEDEEQEEAAEMEVEECLRLPEARAAGFAVSLEGGIYLLGGVVENEQPRDPANEAIRADQRVYFLDTAQFPLQWQEMPSMNEAREHFTAVVVDGRIYAIRGRNEASSRMRGVESWAPGEEAWRQEEEVPVGGSAGIVAVIDECIYVFGGEFTPFTHTGTLLASQVFHVPSGAWRTLQTEVQEEPLDASDVLHLHGVFAATFEEDGQTKILAAGGGDEAWGSPISKSHIFTPLEGCE